MTVQSLDGFFAWFAIRQCLLSLFCNSFMPVVRGFQQESYQLCLLKFLLILQLHYSNIIGVKSFSHHNFNRTKTVLRNLNLALPVIDSTTAIEIRNPSRQSKSIEIIPCIDSKTLQLNLLSSNSSIPITNQTKTMEQQSRRTFWSLLVEWKV